MRTAVAGDTAPVATKRPLWRRIARIAGRVVGALLVLVVLAVGFLHTSWGKSFVRGRVEAKLADLVNGRVALGSVDYTFMFGKIRLHDLEIRDASDRPAISVGEIAVDLDRGSVLAGDPVIDDLIVDAVAVSVVQTADGRSNLTGLFKPSDREPLEHIRVARFAVGGTATIAKPDGTTIAVRDLGLTGSADARPAAKQIDVVLGRLAANLAIARPGEAVRNLGVGLDSVTLGRRGDAIDVEVQRFALGALGIESLGAHVRVADGHLQGPQSITIGKAVIDSKKLAALVGHELLLDDVAIDASITGPAEALAIHGAVRTRHTALTLDGTADASIPGRPRYTLALVAAGRSEDLVAKARTAVETDLRVDITGSGIGPADLDAELALAIGRTKIGKIAVDGLTAKASARHGTYRLEDLHAHGLGFELAATGEVAADKALHGRLTVGGSPAKAMAVLAAAGIAIPRKVPAIGRVDLAVTAAGTSDGKLAIELEPTRIAIAGGAVSLAGSARIEDRALKTASTKIGLHALDLDKLAALAGRPPKLHGTLSGAIDLTRTGDAQRADFHYAIALREPAIDIVATGTADASSAIANARVTRSRDHAVLASVGARLPLDANGLSPTGVWRVEIDAARRPLAELAELLPEHLRAKLPAGDVELHAKLAGSPSKPTGTIDVAATVAGPPVASRLDLHASLTPSASGVAITTKGTVALAGASATRAATADTLAAIDATITAPPLFASGKLDIAHAREGAAIDATIGIPDRTLASLASIRPILGEVGGSIGGSIAVRGPPAKPAVDAKLRWHGYATASGAAGETTVTVAGSPTALTAKIDHNGALAIVADIDRSDPDRLAIHARAHAAETPLRPLIPAFAAAKLAGNDPGRLRWDMTGTFALVRGPVRLVLDHAEVTGSLDVTGGAFAIPHSDRRYHDIGLTITSDAHGVQLKSLAVHETDLEDRDRRIEGSGTLALDRFRPAKLALSLRAHDWLLFGSPTLGPADAPRAAADFDIGVGVDLTQPVIAVDATVNSLALRAPDRFERAHQPEQASVSGDIIYLDRGVVAGKLPVAPPGPPAPPAEAHHRRAIDIRIHVPKPIRLNQTPFDVMARGELTVKVRDDGAVTRGGLTMDSGKLSLFGREHELVEGSLTFTDEHPTGWLALTFERRLPDWAMRELAGRSDGARIVFAGSPAKPKTSLAGAANAALAEVMAMHNAGRPVYVTRPGLPASATAQAPRGDQLNVLTFLATNLPDLLFLDRMTAWADPYQYAGSYGQFRNVEAERYSRDESSRVRAVVRPPTPGRSSAELQYDRLLFHDNRRAFGVGARAGDRGGGGLGLFFEWSSDD